MQNGQYLHVDVSKSHGNPDRSEIVFEQYCVGEFVKIFYSSDFEGSPSQNSQKWPFLAFGEDFSKVLCVKPESSYIPLWWIWPSFFHIS